MPIKNVRVTHIQKRVSGISFCIVNVGMIAMKELARPWTYRPENGLFPEISLVQDRMKEYPTIRRINPPKFI